MSYLNFLRSLSLDQDFIVTLSPSTVMKFSIDVNDALGACILLFTLKANRNDDARTTTVTQISKKRSAVSFLDFRCLA